MRSAAAATLALLALVTCATARAEEALPPSADPLDRTLRGIFVAPVRYRFESRDDADFRADLDDEDARDLLKLGFGVDARPIDPVRGRVQLRYTRSWGRNVVNKTLAIDPYGQDAVDLFEAFGELGPFAGFPLSVRVGRQVLTYGEERLVGPLEFVQNSRTWDAAKIIFATDTVSIDAWYGRLVQFLGPDDHNFNRPVDTQDFFGLYGSLKLGDFVIEPYYLVKYNDNDQVVGETGDVAHHILLHSPGARVVWKAPLGFTLATDSLVQTGERGDDPILAFGNASKVTWRAPEPLRPLFELEVESVYGSGDQDPSDGEWNRLDNFYPSNHKFYGEIDFASWQNIYDLELTLRLELFKRALREAPAKPPAEKPYIWERALPAVVPATLAPTLELGWHFLWLAQPKDAWFNSGLRVIRRDPTGDAGRELGQELDVVLRAGPLAVAYAHFFPGDFVRRTTPAGGNVSGADMFYAEVALSF